MLNNSFLQIPSVGSKTEKRIWCSGVTTLEHFLHSPPAFMTSGKCRKISEHIHISREKIKGGDPGYFRDNLPSGEHWRIFRDYRHSTAYIDIETSGYGDPYDVITTIALYDGRSVRYYVSGENLEDFEKDIHRYKVIVSYNGKSFDVPIIERYFRTRISHVHIDLRYILHSLGYSGGLKACEKQLGIGRSGSLAEVDGFFAVLLWYDYRHNHNVKSLETLLAYNIEDVLSLEYLMIQAYNHKIKNIPIEIEEIDFPISPANPFQVDNATVERIKRRFIK